MRDEWHVRQCTCVSRYQSMGTQRLGSHCNVMDGLALRPQRGLETSTVRDPKRNLYQSLWKQETLAHHALGQTAKKVDIAWSTNAKDNQPRLQQALQTGTMNKKQHPGTANKPSMPDLQAGGWQAAAAVVGHTGKSKLLRAAAGQGNRGACSVVVNISASQAEDPS